MADFLAQYGLLAVLLCALIENDITFVLIGVLIERGVLHPYLAVFYGLAGALGHDLFWFSLGAAKSDSIRQSRLYRRLGPLVEKIAARYGLWELFFCRFIYGTRNPSLVFWGVQRLALSRFLFVEIIALALWGSFLTGLGYFLSDRASDLIGSVKSIEHWTLGAALIVVAITLIVRFVTRHEIRKRLSRREP